ncbi:STAS domain-containing protein [Allokutzneria sp. A3M-2-11 16]|uniref:STAS domain-containing protein n=1 Tax=Allokutzneria sp. A3M-2-11 16 TaxID=2962043 RepID=UPI0020B8F239|nr:STAS domain-containing protein [Allokutzneria sp. A3M-2-11 16]MCP3801084.1 STAS domain-containing protein [Allokutzneria sp. A3M-2-11 16]
MGEQQRHSGAEVASFLLEREAEIIDSWRRLPFFDSGDGDQAQVERDCGAVVRALAEAVRTGDEDDPAAAPFNSLRGLFMELAGRRTRFGDSASEVAVEAGRLKGPVVRLWKSAGGHRGVEQTALLVDALGTLRVAVMEIAVSTSAELIQQQQEQLLELSTPVISLWRGILAVPLIGTLDSARSQIAMESLLQAIVDQRAEVAILDITGVSMVDTMVAQHLLKTVMAARMMGAECIISGIRPQIAQTMVQLGIDLEEVTTRAGLADALAFALTKIGYQVTAPTGAIGR